MLVFEILQNDGLLCAHTLSLYLPCLFFVAFYVIHVNTLYTHSFVCASLVSDVPAVVGNEIPTGWETPGTLTDGPL